MTTKKINQYTHKTPNIVLAFVSNIKPRDNVDIKTFQCLRNS